MSLTSIISKLYFRPRWKELEHYKQGGAALQNEVLRYLISRGKETEYGQSHYFPMMKVMRTLPNSYPSTPTRN